MHTCSYCLSDSDVIYVDPDGDAICNDCADPRPGVAHG